jgi:hypothetical protein
MSVIKKEMTDIDLNDTLSDIGESYSYSEPDILFEDHINTTTSNNDSDDSLKITDKNIIVNSKGVNYIKNIDNKSVEDQPIKLWSDTPIIKNQKANRDLYRFKTKRIKVYDLGVPSEVVELNELIDNSMSETSNIINLNLLHKFSDTTGNWKILATYDIIEFKTNI